jgi:ATP-binding cassette subfamily F protein 3
MLSVTSISKSYGPRLLFNDVNFSIEKGDRVALVGANGVGKSTLFNIILGLEEADAGTIALNRGTTLGFLPQEAPAASSQTILGLAVGITDEHSKLRQEMLDLEATGQRASVQYSAKSSRYKELGGYELEPKAQNILKKLAFREVDFRRLASEMSGGWVMRAYIARLLVMAPDLLILDEPTNHLDLETLLWFQNYLLDYPGAIILISHDRSFLNAVLGNQSKGLVMELRCNRLHRYRGNYDDYCLQRAARLEQQWAAYRNQQEQIASLQRFVDRFGSKATKAAQAQSKIKQIERMVKIEAPESDEPKIHIQFPQPESSGQRVITLSGVHHSYGALEVYRGINLEVDRGERIVLIGPNGAGKSTLLKLLAGVLPVQQGDRSLGLKVACGYYSQNRIDMLTPEHTVLEEAMDILYPPLEVTVRTILGSFLFRGDDVFKKVSVLSGGEKSRLSLVKLLLNPPNLLLMDEPTIHLDMDSCEVLMDALEQYQGTLIFISHDVTFIRRLAQKVLHIHSGRITTYAGGYEYYLRKNQTLNERDGIVAGQGLVNAQPENSKEKNLLKSELSAKELKRLEIQRKAALSNRRRELRMLVNKLEREISKLEMQHTGLVDQLQDPSLYEDRAAVEDLNQKLISNREESEARNLDWEKAATELSEMEEQ